MIPLKNMDLATMVKAGDLRRQGCTAPRLRKTGGTS